MTLDDIGTYTKIYIVSKSRGYSEDEQHMFGSGVIALLKGVRDRGSISQAAKTLDMSYSKAWTLLSSTEKQLGIKLVDSVVPQGSTLTPAGEEIVNLYEDIERKVSDYAEKTLRQSLKEYAEARSRSEKSV